MDSFSGSSKFFPLDRFVLKSNTAESVLPKGDETGGGGEIPGTGAKGNIGGDDEDETWGDTELLVRTGGNGDVMTRR